MKETAASSEAKTLGKVGPPRSRITTTTLRFPDGFSPSRRSIRSAARWLGRTCPPKYAPSISAVFPSPPIVNPRMAQAIASRSLCAKTNAVLYGTPRSRDKASLLLPFTSLQNATIAKR